MTFYYYKKVENEQIKYKADINTSKLAEIYQINFDKYSDEREVKFISENEISINPTNDIIIKNYNVKKVNDKYEISYTLYNYPIICQIIDGLLNVETFDENYNYLQNLLITSKQAQIDEIRRKIDRELRVFNILLDDEKRDNKIFQKIYLYCQEINNICNYDKELAYQAQIIKDAINIQNINDKDLSNLYFNSIVKTKNKKIKKN